MISSENINKPAPPTAESALTKTYSPENVQQILHLAIARQEEGGEISRIQLLEIAQDMGISPATLQAAELEWQNQQGDFQERQVFDLYRRSKLQENLINYGIINAFTVLLDLVAGDGLSWSLYLLLAWGLGMALQARKTYQKEGTEYEQSFQRWRVKKQLGTSFNTLMNKWLKPSN